jgi:hypothetical protein
MKYKIKEHIKELDLVVNVKDTYPKCLLDMKKNKAYHEHVFYTYLQTNKVHLIAYHCTRLTDFEINEIKTNGLNYGGKDLLYKKIENLPESCNDIKDDLLKHVKGLRHTQADQSIYVSFGNLDLDNKIASYETFTEHWGGESIYNFYDNPNSSHNQHLQYIKNKLHDISTPCIIILRCPPNVYDALSRCGFYNNFMTKSIKTLFDSLNLKTFVPEVIDVVKLTEYSGLDYS